MALIVVIAGQAIATMDGSILAVAAPSLRADLHASGAELQLVVAMYTLALSALVVTGARLGDIIGLRRAFLYGLAGFTLSSLAGGLAPTPLALIIARTFQGAAAALMTPQVLSIIQTNFEGQARARAIGAYSMVLAAGVAVGQILGGILVSAHLLAAAWRPALLVNAPLGAVLLASARHALPPTTPAGRQALDLRGVGLLTLTLLALIVPLTLGRGYGWPLWVWPCLGGGALAGSAFVIVERRLKARGQYPLFNLGVLLVPGVAAGVLAVVLIMAGYSGFVLTVTLYLQTALRFSPLHAGLIFAIYASGFAIASLTWTKLPNRAHARLPVLGPLLMATALLATGVLTSQGAWPLEIAGPLLLAAGVGHAIGFSPVAHRLTTLVQPAQATDLSGLILTADWIGTVLGAASFVGLYFTAARHGAGHAFAITTDAIAATIFASTATAAIAMSKPAPRRRRTAPQCRASP